MIKSQHRPSDTIVRYGTDPQRLTETQQSPWGDQVHRVELSRLEPGTEYFVEVVGPEGDVRGQARFRTEAPGAAGPKITDGPRIEFLGTNSAVIAWTTNEPANGVVRYGTEPGAQAETAEAPSNQTTHRVTLRRLKPGAIYYFSVESSTGRDQEKTAKSGVAPFRTPETPERAMRISQP